MTQKSSAFTIIELLLTCALLICMLAWLLQTPAQLNDQFVRVAAQQLQLILTQECVQARRDSTARNIAINVNEGWYSTYESPALSGGLGSQFPAQGGEKNHKIHHLPPSVTFGFPPGAQGPPSKPIRALTKAVTFSCDAQKIPITPTGVLPPGTIYLTNRERTGGFALSSTRNPVAPIRCYCWRGGSWVVW